MNINKEIDSPLSSLLEELPSPPEGKTGWPWTVDSDPLPDLMPDGSAWPKISVVTPSYNQAQFIEETIRSVLLQGYPNLEFIIIDGGSTDNTLNIIKKYEPWISYWVSEPDRGQSHAINKGIAKATGKIFFWLNSDDLVLPGACERVAKNFMDNPKTKMVIGQAKVIDAKANEISELFSNFSTWEDLITSPYNKVRQVSTFFARSLFDECGLLNEGIEIAMDIELFSRLTRNHKPTVISDFVSAFRVQGQSKSFLNIIQGYMEVDRFRKQLLQGNNLLSKYSSASSENWLNLAKQEKFDKSDRIICLKNAVKSNPKILLKRQFWSVIPSILMKQ